MFLQSDGISLGSTVTHLLARQTTLNNTILIQLNIHNMAQCSMAKPWRLLCEWTEEKSIHESSIFTSLSINASLSVCHLSSFCFNQTEITRSTPCLPSWSIIIAAVIVVSYNNDRKV